MTGLFVELKKGRHKKLWLVPLIFLVVLFLWSAYTYQNADAEDLAAGYTKMFYQVPLMNTMLMSVLLSVLASRLCDMEIKGQTLKLLYTLQQKGSFYDLKFVHECLYLLLFTIGECLLFPLSGKLYHFTEPLSLPLLLRHGVALFLAGTVILILQHILSLLCKNQIAPLFIGLAGAFLGLFSMFFPPALTRVLPWSYFGAFLPYRMEYDPAARIMSFYELPFPLGLFIGYAVFGIGFYLVCRSIFLKKEV